MKILVVDDSYKNRKLLKQFLLLKEFEVFEASNGFESIKTVENEKIDLVLMDILMPEMNGYEAAQRIKNISGDIYLPIIYITALNSDEALVSALRAGGDDFITKPVSFDILQSKMNVHLDIRKLSVELNKKNSILNQSIAVLNSEHELIENFFDKALSRSFVPDDIFKLHLSSQSLFNGDLFLARQKPGGGFYLVFGDFSGHGLTAAMGTLPVSQVFYTMTSKGSNLHDIVTEMNNQLNNLLPTGMFFAATMMEINSNGNTISLWTGGLPPLYLLNTKTQTYKTISSKNLSLGILDKINFNVSIDTINVNSDERLYVYSDGIIEAMNHNGEMFGTAGIEQIMKEAKKDLFFKIIQELEQFKNGSKQTDDISLIEINASAVSNYN